MKNKLTFSSLLEIHKTLCLNHMLFRSKYVIHSVEVRIKLFIKIHKALCLYHTLLNFI